MKFTDESGKQWEFRGDYRAPEVGDNYLADNGTIYTATMEGRPGRAIVYAVPVVHEFGGVRFEETGEFRWVQRHEWYLDASYPFFLREERTGAKYNILRLVKE